MKSLLLLTVAGALALGVPSANAAEVFVSIGEHHHHHHHPVLVDESRHVEIGWHGHRYVVVRRTYVRPDGSRYVTVSRFRA